MIQKGQTSHEVMASPNQTSHEVMASPNACLTVRQV